MILQQLIEIICLKTMGEVIYLFVFLTREIIARRYKVDTFLSILFLPPKTLPLQWVVNTLIYNKMTWIDFLTLKDNLN